MQHTDVRELLSRGRTNSAVQAHLRDCPACRAHAEGLAAVLRHAPSLVPQAPTDLHGRVLASVARTGPHGTAADGDATVTHLSARRSRRWATWGTAATAAAAVAIGALWFGPATEPGDEPAQVLAAAVQRTQSGPATTGFRFEVTGSALVRLPEVHPDALDATRGTGAVGRGPTPRSGTPSAPSVQRAGLQLPPLEVPTLEPPTFELPSPPTVEVPPLEPPVVDLLEAPSLEGLCSRFSLSCVEGAAGSSVPLAADYASTFRRLGTDVGREARGTLLARLHLQLELERLGIGAGGTDAGARPWDGLLELRFDGAGRTDGTRTSTYLLHWQVLQPGSTSGSMEVVTRDDRAWTRTSSAGPWVASTGTGRFHLSDVEAVHALDEALAGLARHEGPVSELAEATLAETRVRRFSLRSGAANLEAWVGRRDGLLHRIVLEHGPEGAPSSTPAARTVFDLHDHGAAEAVEAPSEDLPLGDAPVTALPPFWLDLDTAVLVPDEY